MAWRSELRGAIHRADGRAVVALLGTGAPSEDALQLIGDGLILALAQQVKGTLEPAAKCAEALRLRDWTGDSVLAERLDALLGSGPTPMLRYVPVDLEELADVLEGDPLDGGGRLDRQSGEVWPHAAIENARDMGEEDEDESDDTQRWLWIRSHGSRAGYQDMRDFIGTVRDTRRADRLEIAIEGRGAFRRFKDVLGRWPEELQRWYAFADERQRGRARDWLADEGYLVSPMAPS